jgi:parvulin-like peptidyl-prolyl isomerase
LSIVVLIGIASQHTGTSAEAVTLTQQELDLHIKQLGARQKAAFANDPSARKEYLKRIEEALALASEAQRRGLDENEKTRVLIEIGEASALARTYFSKHSAEMGPQGPQIPPDEIARWSAEHKADLDRYQRALSEGQMGGPGPSPNEIATLFIIAERARAEGLAADPVWGPETSLAMKLGRVNALMQAIEPELEKETTYSDEDITAYYNLHGPQGGLDEIHTAHILIPTMPIPSAADPTGGATPDPEKQRELAEQVLARVKAGGDFAALANEFSGDPGSKDKGGDLGWTKRFALVPEFEETAYKLQPGEVSGVVKSDFGYHIIKMIERRPPGDLTPELRAQLKDRLQQQAFEAKVEEIAKRSRIDLPEDFAVEAPPEMPQQMFPPMGAEPGHEGHGH